MLVTLTSSTSGEIMLFAEIARSLFDIIGKEGTARGVFTTEQLPDAIEKLRAATVAGKTYAPYAPNAHLNAVSPKKEVDEESEDKTSVALAQRAFPLIELMERTLGEGGYVMWQAAKDF